MKEQATLTVTEAQFKEMLDVTTVGYHDEVYINIQGGRVRLLAGSPGSSAGTYTDFVEAFFEDVDETAGKTEAYFDADEVLSYIELVSSGPSTKMDVTFHGSENDRLASRLVVTPAGDSESFEVSLVLASGQSVIESVPASLPQQFDAQNRFVPPGGDEPLGTEIDTTIASLQKINNAVSLLEELDYKPITVKGGEFRLDVGEESNQKISARLPGEVTGDDVSNVYGGHFDEIVRALEGGVFLYLDEGGPLEVLQEKNHMTVRHLLGSAK